MLLSENLCNYHLWTSFFIFLSTTNLLFSIGFGLLTFYLRNYQIFNQLDLSSGYTGGGQSFSLLPPYIVLNYIIRHEEMMNKIIEKNFIKI